MGIDKFSTSKDHKGSAGGTVSGMYSDKELLDAIRSFYKSYGDFTIKEYQQNVSNPSYSTIKRRFGTFNQAKIEAGIEISRKSKKRLKMTDGMEKPSDDKAYIVGCLLTDGWIHTGKTNHIGFQVKDKELAEKFGVSLSEWGDIRWDGFNSVSTQMEARGPIDIENGEDNWRVKKGTEVAKYLNSYAQMPYKDIFKEFKDYKKTLLEAIWDAEGSITKEGNIRFSNSDKVLLKLYMLLLDDLTSLAFDSDWSWLSNDKKGRSYGDFKVSNKISDSDTRNISFSRSFNSEFAQCVNSNVDRKSEKLNKWL